MTWRVADRDRRRPRRLGWVRMIAGVLAAIALVIAAVLVLQRPIPDQGPRPAFDPVVRLPAVLTPTKSPVPEPPSPL